ASFARTPVRLPQQQLEIRRARPSENASARYRRSSHGEPCHSCNAGSTGLAYRSEMLDSAVAFEPKEYAERINHVALSARRRAHTPRGLFVSRNGGPKSARRFLIHRRAIAETRLTTISIAIGRRKSPRAKWRC